MPSHVLPQVLLPLTACVNAIACAATSVIAIAFVAASVFAVTRVAVSVTAIACAAACTAAYVFSLHQLLLSDCGCLLWVAVAALPQHIWLRIWPLLSPLFKRADTVIEFKDGLCHAQCPKHLLTPSLLPCSSQSSGSVVCEQKRIAYILRHNCRRAHAYIQGFRALTVNPHLHSVICQYVRAVLNSCKEVSHKLPAPLPPLCSILHSTPDLPMPVMTPLPAHAHDDTPTCPCPFGHGNNPLLAHDDNPWACPWLQPLTCPW